MALARTRELGGGSIAETTARQDRRGCRSTINRYIERSGEGYMDDAVVTLRHRLIYESPKESHDQGANNAGCEPPQPIFKRVFATRAQYVLE